MMQTRSSGDSWNIFMMIIAGSQISNEPVSSGAVTPSPKRRRFLFFTRRRQKHSTEDDKTMASEPPVSAKNKSPLSFIKFTKPNGILLPFNFDEETAIETHNLKYCNDQGSICQKPVGVD